MRSALGGGAFVLAVAACGFGLYGRHGHGGDDGGFILALAWRLVNGEVPYRDFVYVRPPFSPMLHTLTVGLLPATWVVITERLLFYAAVALYSWLAAGMLVRRGGIVPRPLLALAGVVVSVLWFPPMAWHTVDGILLAVLGIVCLDRDDGGHRVGWSAALGGVLLVGAAATKQPYALVLPAALLWVRAEHGHRRAFAAASGAALAGVALGGTAMLFGVLTPMVRQIVGASSLHALFSAGVLSYARGVVHTVVPPLVAGLILAAVGRLIGRRLPAAAFPWLMVTWMFGAAMLGTLTANGFQPLAVNFPAALWVLAALATFRDLRRFEPAAGTCGLLLVVSWCASISWGWQTPALFATPILFAVLEAARREAGARPRPLAAAILALGLLLQAGGYRKPYADAGRDSLTVPLGDTVPRLAGVISSPEEAARLTEFLAWQRVHGKSSFTVLPGFPLAHFLVDAMPPPGVDWARNPEVAGREGAILAAWEAAGTAAFVERDARVCAEGAACSALTAYVVEHWTRIERGRFFDVYLPPALGNRVARDIRDGRPL